MKKKIIASLIGVLLTHQLSAQPQSGPIDDLSVRKIEDEILRNKDHVIITPTTPIEIKPDQPLPMLTIKTSELESMPDILIELMITSLKKRDINSIRLLLPYYKKLPQEQQNNIISGYAEALIAQSDGKYRDAIHYFQNILAQSEDYQDLVAPIQFQLAQNLFANKAYKDAKDTFITVKENSNTPEIVEKNINQYLEAIDKANKPEFNMGFNYLDDDNINGAPPQSEIGDWTLPEPEKAQGLMYSLSLGKDFNIKGNHYLHTLSYLYGEYYWNNKEYNDVISRTYLGYAYKDAYQSIYISPFFERRWFSNRPYSYTTGLRLAYDRLLSSKWKMYSAIEYGRMIYDEREHLDGNQYSISSTLLYAPSDKQFFYGGLNWDKEQTKYSSDSYQRPSVRLGWGRQWPKEFGTNLQASYAERRYRGPDIFNIQKKMEEYQVSFSIWNKKISYKKIMPKLTFSWQKRHSNHPFYKYDRKKVYLDISKAF